MTIPSKTVYEIARTWLGVKWVHQGRTRAGIDCGGLLYVVADELGLDPVDTAGYGRRPTGDDFEQMILLGGAYKIPREDLRPGDIIATKVVTFPSHAGIVGANTKSYGAPLTLIHAYAPARKVVEGPLDDFWFKRIWGTYRIKGVES